MTAVRISRARELLEGEIGRDLVALDVVAGTCFGFNEIAARVWKLLENPRTIKEIESILLAEFDVGEAQCRHELQELLTRMQELGLVRVGNANAR